MIKDKKLRAIVEQYVQENGLPDDSSGPGYILAMTDALLKTHVEYGNIARAAFRKTLDGIFKQVQSSQIISHLPIIDLTSDKTLEADDVIRMDTRKRKSDTNLAGDFKRQHIDDQAKFSDSKTTPSSPSVNKDCLNMLMRDGYKKRCTANPMSADSGETPVPVGTPGRESPVFVIDRTGDVNSPKDNVPEDYTEASMPGSNAELSLVNESHLSILNVKMSVDNDSGTPANTNGGSHSKKAVASGRKRKKSGKPEENANTGSERRKDFFLEDSDITLDDVAALDTILSEENETTIVCADQPIGILITGAKGTGKSMLAKAIIGELKVPYIEVAADLLCSNTNSGAFEILREFAISCSPCAVLIENIPNQHSSEFSRPEDMLRTRLSSLFLEVNRDQRVIWVVATALKRSSVDETLLGSPHFEVQINLRPLKEKARLKIIESILQKGVKLAPCVDTLQLAQNTPGYAPGDLAKLVTKSISNARMRIFKDRRKTEIQGAEGKTWSAVRQQLPAKSEVEVTAADFEVALKQIVPAARNHGNFVEYTNVSWDDIGGFEDIRIQLQNSFLRPIKYPVLLDRFGQNSRPIGVLLYGPPGCGKTLIAKALANEASLSFLAVNGPELLSKYVGESEKAVREIFEKAQANAPCIVYFDEIDSVGQTRETGTGSSKVNMVNQLLTLLDGVQPREQVYVIGSTNRLDTLDEALLRPGRFNDIIEVGLPNEKQRYDILKTVTRKYPQLDDDVDLEQLASDSRCDNMSGADMKEIVNLAIDLRMDGEKDLPSIEEQMKLDENLVLSVGKVHFENALERLHSKRTNQQKNQRKSMRKISHI